VARFVASRLLCSCSIIFPCSWILGIRLEKVGNWTKVGVQEIDRVEERDLEVVPELIECGTVEASAAVTIVDVFLDEDVAGRGDLALGVDDLALDGALFCRFGTYSRVQHGLLHTP